eukprot:GEZU01017024.1.p2 GENE.GEZU01017024.1~~GEZU01017024.1.p2  ORF type:complete len:145 (-),score=18.33 GEZU01017024.1:119-553(-)
MIMSGRTCATTRPVRAATPHTLICRACWESFNEGTLIDPSYRPPQWPSLLDLERLPEPLVNGFIKQKSTGLIIGEVEGYNRRGHFANKVRLYECPECAEHGSLDRTSWPVEAAYRPTWFSAAAAGAAVEVLQTKESSSSPVATS